MHAEDLMTTPIATCHVNDAIKVAAQLMWDRDCGALPVVNDEGRLAGLITDRDICMAALTQGETLDNMLVNRAMATHVVSAKPETTVGEIEHLMAHFQIRRIPIVDADGKPIGIVSLNDLARESVQPVTKMQHGLQKIARALAAICQPRATSQKAA